MSDDNRIERFRSEVAELKTATARRSTEQLLLWLAVALMLAGVVIGFAAYLSSHQQTDVRNQNDMIVLALAGVATAVVGGALFLRYSFARFLRFWLLRSIYEGHAHDGAIAAPVGEPAPAATSAP